MLGVRVRAVKARHVAPVMIRVCAERACRPARVMPWKRARNKRSRREAIAMRGIHVSAVLMPP